MATLVVIIVGWELAARLGYVPRYILPSPTGIAVRFYELHVLILHESLFTLQATLLGFVLSVVIGVPLGLALMSWHAFNRAVYPLLIGSQVVPKVALAPLFLVWFGFGLLSKVLITFLVAFFPVLIAAVVELQATEIEKIHVARGRRQHAPAVLAGAPAQCTAGHLRWHEGLHHLGDRGCAGG